MAIDIYLTIVSPPCRTVLMVAKHLNIELNQKTINLQAQEHLTPEYLKLNPAHTVPTIDDSGFVLWESRAIAQYLCNKYAPDSDLYPSEPKHRAQVDRLLNFDIGSYFPSIREAILMKIFRGVEPTEEKVQALKNNLKLLDQFISSNNGYVAVDHLTIADISILAGTTIFSVVDYDISDYPNLKDWYEKLKTELPYFAEINGKARDLFLAFIEQIRQKNQAN